MRNILSIFHDFKIVIITFEFRFEFNWHWIFMEDNTFSDDVRSLKHLIVLFSNTLVRY